MQRLYSITEKKLEQLNILRLQGCMKRLKSQPLLLFMQKVMDFLQKRSEENWIRVFYIPDNFVTFLCATERREKEAGNRWSNFELFCQHVLICCTKKPQQKHQKEHQRCATRWVLKKHLEAHFDFSVTTKIFDFPEPQLKTWASTLRICQCIWTYKLLFLLLKNSFSWFRTLFADFQDSSNLKR